MVKYGDVIVLRHGDFNLGMFRALKDFAVDEFTHGYAEYHKNSIVGRDWLSRAMWKWLQIETCRALHGWEIRGNNNE